MIAPALSSESAARFLGQVLAECAYTIETAYTETAKNFKGIRSIAENHGLVS